VKQQQYKGSTAVGSIPNKGRYFPLRNHVQTRSGTHPASYAKGTGGTTAYEADHSPPSDVEVRTHGVLPPHPLYYAFMVWCLENGMFLPLL
jgi:hypothetical protein